MTSEQLRKAWANWNMDGTYIKKLSLADCRIIDERVIAFAESLRAQLAEKEREIARLTTELEQRWIAVGERLPAPYERVRVYTSYGESHSRLASSPEVHSGEPFWEGMPNAKVTHWQPLPSPPKEAQ